MDTAESIPAGAKAACDALCTVLGVKVPLRLIPQPPTLKPHILIKRDIAKDDESNDADPKCARFTFVANKRINVNKGAVLLFGIEQPTPDGAPKSATQNLDSFLLEADLMGTADEEEDAPKVKKKVASEVKRARSQARRNIVALPPKMRKSLGEKLPNMYYAAAHELRPTLAIPSSVPSDAHTSRVFATAAVQTDDLVVPSPSPPPISIIPRAPSCSLDDLRKSPVQLPSPVSADHARETTPNASLAPLEDEMAYPYEMERSLSPMDLESGSSSLEASPARGQVALPDENVAPTPQVLPEAGRVSFAIADDALPPPAEELDLPPLVAVSSDSTSANVLETPPRSLAEAQALRAASPPPPDSPELIVIELSGPMEGVIDSLPEVEVKREQIQAVETLAFLDDNVKPSSSVPVSTIPDAPSARSAKEIPSEPRAMRNAVSSPTWAAGRAPPTFVKSTQASTWDAQTTAPAYAPATPTLYNPLGIRPSANAPVFHRAPPTGPRSLLGASSSSSSSAGAPKKPVVVGAKWTASRGPAQAQPGAPVNATLSSSSSASSSSISASTSTSSSAPALASSQPTSPALSWAASPPTAPKADRDLGAIIGYTSPSPPPEREAAPSSSPPSVPPLAIKPAPVAASSADAPASSKWKRIDHANGGTSSCTPTPTSTLPPALPSSSVAAPPSPVPAVQPVSIPIPTASSPTVPSTNAQTPPIPAVRPVPTPLHTSTSTSTAPPNTSPSTTTPRSTSVGVTPPPAPAIVRTTTIPLPSKPMAIPVIPTPNRPASVLAIPASFRNAATRSATPTAHTAPPASSSSNSLSLASRLSPHTAILVPNASWTKANSASVPPDSLNASNPSSTSNAFNTSNPSDTPITTANASPSNPRKRPHESSVKTVEVKLSSSPAVSSVPLGPVKIEMSPTLERASLDPVASSSAASSSSCSAAVAGYSRTTTPVTPLSFLKTHVPQPASSQMAVDADPTEGTDTTDATATTASGAKKKRRRQKKPQRRTGDVQNGQALAAEWPTTVPKLKHRLVPNANPPPGASAVPGVKKIMVSEDGARIAILCEDHTLRIWLNESSGVAPGEIARLNHKQSLVTACWMDMRRILVLTRDGVVLLWTRSMNGKEEWTPERLFVLPEIVPDGTPCCLAYSPDRIAVSVPSGVKIWLHIECKWQQQRDIIRGGVTAIKFVHDGVGLIGGCRDGVIWYCEVPNGTLRAYAFISQQRRAIESIDIHFSGQRMLVTQEGGWAHLITLNPNENRGTIERTYTSETFHNSPTPMFPGMFAMRGQTVLYGYMQDCVPIWNRKKGGIVYGLKHNKGDVVQAAATFDDPSGVGGSMITGTSKGELFWWPPPEVHQSASHSDTPDDVSRKRQKVG